jgi:hypothetical protein
MKNKRNVIKHDSSELLNDPFRFNESKILGKPDAKPTRIHSFKKFLGYLEMYVTCAF